MDERLNIQIISMILYKSAPTFKFYANRIIFPTLSFISEVDRSNFILRFPLIFKQLIKVKAPIFLFWRTMTHHLYK